MGPDPRIGFAGGITIETWQDRLAELDESNRNPDTIWRTKRLLAKYQFNLDPDSDDFAQACDAIARAEIAAIRQIASAPNPTDYSSGTILTAAKTATGFYRLCDAVDLYRATHPHNAHMLKKSDAALRAWSDLMKHQHLKLVTSQMVYEFTDLLAKAPTNATERFPGQSLAAAISENEQRVTPYPTLQPKTIKAGYLGPLQAAVNVALARGHVDNNPFYNVRVEGASKASDKRRAFRTDELSHLFQHPIYTGCESFGRRNSKGAQIIRDHYYWPAIIALFSGMRAEEIAELDIADIVVTSNVLPPHFRVKGTKTEAAKRDVPLHPRLLDLGLGQHVTELTRKGHRKLFPDWKTSGSKSKSSGRALRNFNAFVVDRDYFEAPYPTFHCFRQTLRLELEKGNYPQGFRKVVMGHSLDGMDRNYLKPTIQETYPGFCDVVKFADVKLDHLTSKIASEIRQ